MRKHDGHKTRVVDRDPSHAVVLQQFLPNAIGMVALRNDVTKSLDNLHASLRPLDGQAAAVLVDWPRRDIPEFSDVLQRHNNSFLSRHESAKIPTDLAVLARRRIKSPQQDARV